MTDARQNVLFFAVLICLALVLFFFKLDERDLWGSHEARAAQNAQRMLDDRAWLMPRLFDDQYDFQKPPMYYWLVAAASTLHHGIVDAETVRLPAAASALATILLVFFVLAWRGRPVAGFIAGLTLGTCQHFTWLARTARIDMPLTLSVSLAILGLSFPRRWRWIAFVALAVGFLLKGPVGVVLPLSVIVIDALVNRRFAPDDQFPTQRRDWILGCGLAACLAAPWFIWVTIQTHGDFFRVFFIYHNVQRALGGATALASHPWWYYGTRLLADAQPWTLFAMAAAIALLARGTWRIDREGRLGLIWLVVMVGVLSLARFKRADYLVPSYPGLTILLGCSAERIWIAARAPVRRWCMTGMAFVIATTVAAWMVFIAHELPQRESEREQIRFASVIRQYAPKPQIVLFFRAEAHLLTFHLERPVNTFLEWENLDRWAADSETHYVVMPPECAATWRDHLARGELEEICRNTDLSGGKHEKPLVLMRTRAKLETYHAAP